VAPSDRHLLAFCFKGKFYVEGNLPFGLTSSPAIFDNFGELLEYALANGFKGVFVCVRYCDDLLLIAPTREELVKMVEHVKSLCKKLGVLLALDKFPGEPLQVIDFIGAWIDAVNMRVSVTVSRLDKTKKALDELREAYAVTEKQLQRGLGLLSFVSTIVPLLRPFLNSSFRLLSANVSYPARVPSRMKQDLASWYRYFCLWNGSSIIRCLDWDASGVVRLWCDACPEGLGYLCPALRRYGLAKWTLEYRELAYRKTALSLTFLELASLVAAVLVVGPLLKRSKLVVFCDNAGVVGILQGWYARDPGCAQLLMVLGGLLMSCDLLLKCLHVPTEENGVADELSRVCLVFPSFSPCPFFSRLFLCVRACSFPLLV
jgi:hypothetical protein